METKENMVITSRLQKIYEEQSSFEQFSLTERERAVLEMRYGLNGEKPQTLEEIGSKMNVTRERIRQIEAKALMKMRSPRRKALLRDYL